MLCTILLLPIQDEEFSLKVERFYAVAQESKKMPRRSFYYAIDMNWVKRIKKPTENEPIFRPVGFRVRQADFFLKIRPIIVAYVQRPAQKYARMLR